MTRTVMISQLDSTVVVTVVASALLVLYVELRVRSRPRQTCGCDPIFQALRNGRVRFSLNDLRNSKPPPATGRHARDRSANR